MNIIQALLSGLLIGAVYALMASGLTLVFGVMRVINLAHGAFAILAAFFTYTLWRWLGLDPLVSIPVVVIAMFALGWLAYVLIIRHVRGSHVSMTVLATFGIALLLEGVMGYIWQNQSRSVRTPYTDTSIALGPFYVPTANLIAAAIAIVVLVGLHLLLNGTWQGRAIRASSVNESGALLVGVSVRSIAATTFAIGIATLGAGGAIIAATYPFIPGSHYQWIARLLAIVVLGGLGSLAGAVIGALIIGVGEQLATLWLGASWVVAVPFFVIFIVLLLRPQGILGQRLREDAVH
ncbi:branched-chain amino acid ABC transporter permease [Microbacterium album]|uniref:Branched-chain amino acid ABC transporter permease n=1 Tax=Microbacterium album TaxID=2053191 RepID=A0A917IGD5_9MICO|nr:branched-chain amino acid ABC transporter permease [Microbacterium album]GGH43669.1 branched-chain amino acid ABC transporter permease [Microbacterium album]